VFKPKKLSDPISPALRRAFNTRSLFIRPFLFCFDEDDDNLRYHSLIAELSAAVIPMRYPKVHAAKGQEYDRVYIVPGLRPPFHVL